MKIFIVITWGLFYFTSLPSVLGATFAEDNGVVWEFDQDYPVGQYADGSNYVVAPSGLKVIRITPEWDGTQHGSELNPERRSNKTGIGWSRGVKNWPYAYSLNVADDLPVKMIAGDMLVSAQGNTLYSKKGRIIHDISILSVVAVAPAAGSFRPPLIGSDKRVRGTTASLQYNQFPALADPRISTPVPETFVKAGGTRPYLDLSGGWQTSSLKTEAGLPNYGRDLSSVTGRAALWLCLNNPPQVKAVTMIPMVQQGIDVFGYVKDGGTWAPNGGHCNGRKLLMAVAAKALGDAEMLNYLNGEKLIFQEDAQHDFITQRDVDYTVKGDEPYTLEMLKNWNGTGGPMPEWFSNGVLSSDSKRNERDASGAEWNKKYRNLNGVVNLGSALAAELMGLRTAWNDEAFFRYLEERFWVREKKNRSSKVGSMTKVNDFVGAMWDRHKGIKRTKHANQIKN